MLPLGIDIDRCGSSPNVLDLCAHLLYLLITIKAHELIEPLVLALAITLKGVRHVPVAAVPCAVYVPYLLKQSRFLLVNYRRASLGRRNDVYADVDVVSCRGLRLLQGAGLKSAFLKLFLNCVPGQVSYLHCVLVRCLVGPLRSVRERLSHSSRVLRL